MFKVFGYTFLQFSGVHGHGDYGSGNLHMFFFTSVSPGNAKWMYHKCYGSRTRSENKVCADPFRLLKSFQSVLVGQLCKSRPFRSKYQNYLLLNKNESSFYCELDKSNTSKRNIWPIEMDARTYTPREFIPRLLGKIFSCCVFGCRNGYDWTLKMDRLQSWLDIRQGSAGTRISV